MGQIKNIKLHIVTDIKFMSTLYNYAMASFTLRSCKQLCTKTLNSLGSLQARSFSIRPVLHQLTADSDFDTNRDAKLGDFSKYNITNQTVRKLTDAGVNHLFEVQYKTFEKVRDGTDVFVQARTGTGKTLGFALPIIEAVQAEGRKDSGKFPQPPAALVIAPTRELAIQIAKEFEKFASQQTKVSCFYGGVPKYPQNQDVYRGIDILVGTPGRLLDHLTTGNLDISTVRHVVLDEADRMLDMGFQKDIEQIFTYAYTKSNKPQTLLFSATLPGWVRDLTRRYTSENMQQFDLITSAVKSAILVDHKAVKCQWRQHPEIVKHFVKKHCGQDGKALVFTQTKRQAEDLAQWLGRNADYITGDKNQNQRERTLSGFKSGRINILVATDVAARGLDIPKIDLVIQTGPPQDVDSYIHRAGRTGRAGKKGVCVVFYGDDQLQGMAEVEKHAGIQFGDVKDDEALKAIAPAPGTRNDFQRSGGGKTWGDSSGGRGSYGGGRGSYGGGRGSYGGGRESYGGGQFGGGQRSGQYGSGGQYGGQRDGGFGGQRDVQRGGFNDRRGFGGQRDGGQRGFGGQRNSQSGFGGQRGGGSSPADFSWDDDDFDFDRKPSKSSSVRPTTTTT